MRWMIDQQHQDSPAQHAFATLQDTLSLDGEMVTKSPISYLKKCEIDQINYYVKIYKQAGKGLKKWLGKSRIKSEWQNLLFFQSIGIPIPDIIAYGEKRRLGLFQMGALITKEIPNTIDLRNLYYDKPSVFNRHEWVDTLLKRIALYTQLLHSHHFVHNDLKWRNILIRTHQTTSNNIDVFFIDSPLGRKKSWLFLARGIIKDLACLDKIAKNALTRTQRLRFYLYYQNTSTLLPTHKKQIHKIITFFDGRS